MSADDTKLTAALRSYHDGEVWCLGGLHGVVQAFSSYEELMELGNTDKGELAEKARTYEPISKSNELTKAQVRVWLLTIPVIGIPPFLIATMALKSKVNRRELRKWHDDISAKLDARRMHIVSYSVDGVETERGLTHEIQDDAIKSGKSHAWSFPHPIPGQPPLVIRVPLLENGQPCIMSSDGKHAKKNSRGSATSGTRYLIIGRYPVDYGLFATLAEGHNSPLMKTDIIGVDKQDDRAAARLFSAATVEYASRLMPDQLGLSIYLAIIGEAMDAQQNRNLTHCERVKMLWRTRFFLDGWRQYVLDHPHYTLHTHFITRELYDILSIFINAMLALILTHRDFFPDIPLYHWLNSTEPCEHFFGCARKIQKDFTFVEWLIMLPKVAILMAGELRNKLKGAQAKAAAARHGYHHSYFDTRGIDMANLTSFPSDVEFEDMIRVAHTEAKDLLTIVGIELDVCPVVDDDALTAALEALSNDPTPEEEDSNLAPPSAADQLVDALASDREAFMEDRSLLNSTETSLTDMGIRATATTIHDQLRL